MGLPPGHHQCQLGGGAFRRLFRRQQLLDDEPHPVEQERRQGHAQADLHLQCQAGLQPAQKPSSEHQRRLFALPHRGHRVQQLQDLQGLSDAHQLKGRQRFGAEYDPDRLDEREHADLQEGLEKRPPQTQRRGRIHDAGQQPAALRLFEHADPQRVARHQRHRRRSARLDDGAADGELPHVVARTHQLQLPVALHVHRFVPRRRIVEILSRQPLGLFPLGGLRMASGRGEVHATTRCTRR